MKQTSSRIKPMSKMQQERISDNVWIHQAAHNDGNYNRLTAREREIFHMTVHGLSSGGLAERLCIGSRTVETHRENIMKKLGLHSKTELIHYAFQHGLVDVKVEDEGMKR